MDWQGLKESFEEDFEEVMIELEKEISIIYGEETKYPKLEEYKKLIKFLIGLDYEEFFMITEGNFASLGSSYPFGEPFSFLFTAQILKEYVFEDSYHFNSSFGKENPPTIVLIPYVKYEKEYQSSYQDLDRFIEEVTEHYKEFHEN